MPRKSHSQPTPFEGSSLSRREVLVGAAATALAAAATPLAHASPPRQVVSRKRPTTAPALRYMAAAAALPDGRVLITGGYGRPFGGGDSPQALESALLFDPSTGEFAPVAPMQVPRARHAAVTLQDGRVAVLGGISMQPTASVEVYDPRTDTWTNSVPLSQPRYDHVAVGQGAAVFIIGGSSLAMVPSVEAFTPDTASFENPIK